MDDIKDIDKKFWDTIENERRMYQKSKQSKDNKC